MENNSDIIYIKKVQAGNRDAFGYLVEKYQDMVFSIALKIVKNDSDAEEIAQDAFIKAFRYIGGFKAESKFSTWLYSIVYNTAISSLRKKKITTYEIDEGINQTTDVSDTNQMHAITAEEQKKYLKIALEKLNENDQILLTLFYFEEQTLDEISAITGMKASNVKVKVHRARKKLYKVLNDLLKDEVRSII
ncbi:sigma-70 family RNA polymerase sigma factor [Prolixibacteraceae bacterium JC049]|nr:sigma-70 family RNA polymerase sigma factor [Prolixibacteraceae bacterium JC049]